MVDNSKVAGVLGGMGPEATVDFMAKVIALSPASADQDHVRMIVDHNPKVPNRQTALLDGGEDPGPVMAAMAARLETAGADFLVMPCNTAHVYGESIQAAVKIPFVSIIDVTVAACERFESVGVLATDGCLQTKIYQDALAADNKQVILPDDTQLKELMRLVGRIKAGDKGDEVALQMRDIATALVDKGAQAIIAGCTEIPLVLDDSMLDVPFVSSTDVLAAATVVLARGDRELDSMR